MQTIDASDPLARQRNSVGKAIADLRSFSAPAGSDEMKRVMSALSYLGMAYCCIQQEQDNPAWSDD